MAWEENDSTEPKMNSENKQESVPSDTTKTIEPMSAPNECCGIYGLRNKLNDKWYVGQSINIVKRWEGYDTMHCKSQRKLYNALVKYGVGAFDKIILEQCPSDRLNEREDYWVVEKDAIENGYNIRSGGGSRGRHSTETKRLMSVAAIGRKKSASHVAHLPQNQKGYKQSPELIAKRSAALKHRTISDEVRKKMRETQQRLHPRKSHEEILAHRRELYRQSRVGKVPYSESRGRPRSAETRRKISEARRKAECLKRSTKDDSLL